MAIKSNRLLATWTNRCAHRADVDVARSESDLDLDYPNLMTTFEQSVPGQDGPTQSVSSKLMPLLLASTVAFKMGASYFLGIALLAFL